MTGNMPIIGSLGCSYRWAVRFNTLKGVRKANGKVQIPGLWQPVFGLLRRVAGGILWKEALKGKEAWDSWEVFKDNHLQAQEWSTPVFR